MIPSKSIFQNAWVVTDIQANIDYWTQRFGVGPFFTFDYRGGPELTYRGKAGIIEMQVALAQAGDVQIELIKPISNEPNIYRDLVHSSNTQFHHMCMWTDDLEIDTINLEQAGYPRVMYSGPAQARFAYFDTSKINGHMIEILERKPEISAAFEQLKKLTVNWNGKRPVRDFSELFQ